MAVAVGLGVYMIVHPEGSGGLFGFAVFAVLPFTLAYLSKY